ncbi:unnamed protein product [Phyllotreta striolata]|uniref:FAD dependent oxidoreductase domain-containing protein n=1 Tax=Phyllotreta striolata TaxID=444603 RepID=A0A9N9TLI9_PHYSR|nr:unnamed protein product [Phyllotreta striolata]
MFFRSLQNIGSAAIKQKRYIQSSSTLFSEERENPVWRTIRILAEDLQFRKRKYPVTQEDYDLVVSREFPRHVDIVIIGGGAIGTSIAYWIKKFTNYDGVSLIVLDKDPTGKKCTTAISMGAMKQQYSLPENVEMACFGAEFLRHFKKEFGAEAEINLNPAGYLQLASEEGAQSLIDSLKLQSEFDTRSVPLSPEEIKQKFPYIDVSDIAVGSLSAEKQGWFNAWEVLTHLRKKAAKIGAQFYTAEAVDFVAEKRSDIVIEGMPPGSYQTVNNLNVKLMNETKIRTVQFSHCIIAAGHESVNIAKTLGIGVAPGMLSVPLPIEKRKRFVYSFTSASHTPGVNSPMIEDFTGLSIRREGFGGMFLVGAAPHPDVAPPSDSEEDKTAFFNDVILPRLSARIPSFKDAKLTGSWSGDYEFNYYDGNGIMGAHPYYMNIHFATGFSDQGIQQAPAVGRGVAELILDGGFQTIDLTRLGFNRFIVEKPMFQVKVS